MSNVLTIQISYGLHYTTLWIDFSSSDCLHVLVILMLPFFVTMARSACAKRVCDTLLSIREFRCDELSTLSTKCAGRGGTGGIDAVDGLQWKPRFSMENDPNVK